MRTLHSLMQNEYSHYLTEKYTMLRKLRNKAEVNIGYDRIHTQFSEIEPRLAVSVLTSDNKKVKITNSWYGRLVYPEQVLACEKIWILTHTERYDPEIICIENPVMSANKVLKPEEYSTIGETNRQAYISINSDGYFFFNFQLKIQPFKGPMNNSYYSAFFIEDVAHLFAESLKEQLQFKEVKK